MIIKRFGVTDSNGHRSATWICWTPGVGKSDVYLGCRELGGILKASLHQSGSWQVGYSKESWNQKEECLPERQTTRHIEIWPRPSDIAPGFTLAYRIITPATAVNVIQDPPDPQKPIVWISCPPGKAVEIDIVITAPTVKVSNWPGKNGKNTNFVDFFVLSSRETIWIVSHVIDMPSHAPILKRQVTPRFVKGKGPQDIKDKSLRALVFGREPDGSRVIYDCIAQG